ncbi:protein adenylyltransferase SelO-like [Dreissena polymorpha]|uniref:Selenoprotein O n=1 Tax=Dreissena polymorpha TaxID=45954 RepID=A0A9D4KGA6_DREPO|nr:protein adenylyltransferase SelO-like [Dreissena polymorpha]KAH3838616.1 hypothetical protein DPMN_112025 [Dreissena polymorpha]
MLAFLKKRPFCPTPFSTVSNCVLKGSNNVNMDVILRCNKYLFSILLLITVISQTQCINSNNHVCAKYIYGHSNKTDNGFCVLKKNSNSKLIDWAKWKFAEHQLLKSYFPVDTERKNFVRQVPRAVFSFVRPTPLKKNPRLSAVSADVLRDILDLDMDTVNDPDFLRFLHGDLTVPNESLLAHRYGGHQFGHWSGQLGDGRAIMLGEYENQAGERWELQLKGSGLTPYSRRGDGRAVVRSSVREFLCSEAMHALGIPTSRAGSLVVSDDPVVRDQFYDGHVKTEKAAIVLRLAPSWLRIGSLEILAINEETEILHNMVNFIIEHYFKFINSSDKGSILVFFQEVVRKTAEMIAMWQSVGFTHGVCNTDNFSILSLTIDYGPFGFMESYDPGFVPNTSDDEGLYRYEKQPDVGWFNLNKLRLALQPLMSEEEKTIASMLLGGYADIYKSKYMELFMIKLGFENKHTYTESDEKLVAVLLKIMQDTKADFTMSFRELSEIRLSELETFPFNASMSQQYWALPRLENHELFGEWLKLYQQKLTESDIKDEKRRKVMMMTNPRYILRNWIAQVVIKQTENGNFDEIHEVLSILRDPYKYNVIAEKKGFAGPPPEWSRLLKVSCSS